jgi:CubicO group peptidase (beta-lactamase class C family)
MEDTFVPIGVLYAANFWRFQMIVTKMRRTLGLGALAVALSGCGSDADGDRNDRQPLDPWDTMLLELGAGMTERGIPGMGVALVTDGSPPRSAGLGVRSASGGEPVTGDTLFRLGSTTKLFVAATAHAIVDAGQLTLDAPVAVSYVNLDPSLQPLTLDQLLTHRSGVVEASETPPCQHGAGALKAWFDAHPGLGGYVPPGTLFNYSNTGYGIVAAAIEEATGETFTEAISRRMFEPAGITHATFEPGQAASAEHGTGHTFGAGGSISEVPIDDPSSACAMIEAAGGAFVSAADYARFLSALMEGKLLDLPSVERLLAPRAPTGWGSSYRYGHGVYSLDYGATRVFMHGGFWPGWSSFITLVPARGYALVLLSNGGKSEHLGHLWNESLRLTERLLDLTDDAPILTTDPSTWADYVGTYEYDAGSYKWRFLVSQQPDGKLWMRVEGLVGEIGDAALEQGYPAYGNAAGDTFSFYFEKWGGLAAVTFWRDADGAVAYVANQNFVAKRIQ